MRVLAVSSSGRLGGAELSLLEFLRHRPDDVHALALVIGDGQLRERLAAEGIESWVARGLDGRPAPKDVTRFTRSLIGLLGQIKPDVVLAVGIKAASLAMPAARISRAPIVWQKVDFSHDASLARPLGAAVNGVISVSEAAANALGPVRRRRLIRVVGPPIRLPDRPYRAADAGQPAIGTLAALTPYKGQQHIIEAAALLSEEFPQLRTVLAGGTLDEHPGYLEELKQLADGLGIAHCVEFTGFVEDVSNVLARLSVYVSATYRDARGFGLEGMSGAMLEASWVGLPVVATRGGGTPEGLQDGITGTLVDPVDPIGLARAIARYLREPELARSTGEAGRRFTRERFSPEVSSAQLFAALRRVARTHT